MTPVVLNTKVFTNSNILPRSSLVSLFQDATVFLVKILTNEVYMFKGFIISSLMLSSLTCFAAPEHTKWDYITTS